MKVRRYIDRAGQDSSSEVVFLTYVFDGSNDPRKSITVQEKYLPGTGHTFVTPAVFLPKDSV